MANGNVSPDQMPRRRIDLGHVMIYVILTFGALLAIVPFLWMISGSLMKLSEAIGRAVLPSVPQWENYREAWIGANFKDYFMNSVIIAAISGRMTKLIHL